MEKAFIDRFEEDIAVLIVGEDERKLNVPRSSLPEGAEEGDWLQVELQEGTLTSAKLDREELQRRKQQVEDLLRELRGRGPEDGGRE